MATAAVPLPRLQSKPRAITADSPRAGAELLQAAHAEVGMGLFSSLCLPIAPDRAQIAMVRTRRSSQAAPLRVAFLHPDLGLGGECRALLQVLRTRRLLQQPHMRRPVPAGAERLIVDAAVELAGHGHTVRSGCVPAAARLQPSPAVNAV